MSDPAYPPASTSPPDPIRGAKEDLRAAAAQARAAAGQVAGQVSQEASAAVQSLKQEGAEVVQAVQARAADIAEQGKRTGAEHAEGIARAVHRAADELEGTSPQLAGIVHDAAGTIDRMARGLRESSPGELMEGVTDFARRNPLAFFGAAVLTGFALARFARASTPRPTHRYNEYGGYGDYDSPPSTSSYAGTAQPTTASGAPGWMEDESGTSRPATLASASLGGAAAMRSSNDSSAPLGSGQASSSTPV